ncbi:hypothetical protein BAE44_0002229 [Dichanthelium oligosanthes]|uniref:Leucine-rich repeat-containing N-terminal plant-type domain-containing protein n=1 Tax=Dichanthelium oligosanthes TaxID=888268 RepID=A0A1E5WH91_9POAL|nr:hypothetical protein BAE44_0002229 [Dichanthelium oligosanthes]
MAHWTKTQASLLHASFLLLLFASRAIEQEAGSLLRWKSTLSPGNNGDKPPPSTPLPSWSPTIPTCSWSDVRCDAAGHVAELSLPGAGLHGRLDSLDLAALPALAKLDLRDNNITGASPANVVTNTNLTYLDLSHNNLSGQIPATMAPRMRRTRYLNLSSNGLHGPVPRSLCSSRDAGVRRVKKQAHWRHPAGPVHELAGGQTFHVQKNSLAGSIPPEIGNATKLQSVILQTNCLSGQLPAEIGRLATLQHLNLQWNSDLLFMDLSNNAFSGIVRMSKNSNLSLESVHLANNILMGGFPLVLKRCRRLMILDLGENKGPFGRTTAPPKTAPAVAPPVEQLL